MDNPPKKLYRSNQNRMIAGVCGGIAEYTHLDPTIVRIIWVIITLFGGAGLIAYLVCALVIPNAPA